MHKDQFTATGPSFTGSGVPRSAFSTNASDMVYGVNVQGRRCGVLGESDPFSQPEDREQGLDKTGIHGIGDYGIDGLGRRFAGVLGRLLHPSSNEGGGVVGVALRGGTGVVGQSRAAFLPALPLGDNNGGEGTGVLGESGSGAGVLGHSLSGSGVQGTSAQGAGVTGTSSEGAGVLGLGETGNGVEGRSKRRVGVSGSSDTLSGIEGFSSDGAGVAGNSLDGPGGSFASVHAAQIHLSPAQAHPSPKGTMKGRAGDLLVTIGNVPGTPRKVARLWFCVESGAKSTAVWEQVSGPKL